MRFLKWLFMSRWDYQCEFNENASRIDNALGDMIDSLGRRIQFLEERIQALERRTEEKT